MRKKVTPKREGMGGFMFDPGSRTVLKEMAIATGLKWTCLHSAGSWTEEGHAGHRAVWGGTCLPLRNGRRPGWVGRRGWQRGAGGLSTLSLEPTLADIEEIIQKCLREHMHGDAYPDFTDSISRLGRGH